MRRLDSPSKDAWESDEVWELLDQSPPQTPAPRFAENVVRMARLSPQETSWWSRLAAAAPWVALTTTAAAAVVAAAIVFIPAGVPQAAFTRSISEPTQAESIEDIAETEALNDAAERLDDFSDTELVSLIGF